MNYIVYVTYDNITGVKCILESKNKKEIYKSWIVRTKSFQKTKFYLNISSYIEKREFNDIKTANKFIKTKIDWYLDYPYSIKAENEKSEFISNNQELCI